ncbi:MAG: hypothetical protein CM15mP107_2250 [Bacteroidota bacterium]|nr:MAG: hypothetical protein CM15mP107_2250 [Bacteroidota bacterium]
MTASSNISSLIILVLIAKIQSILVCPNMKTYSYFILLTLFLTSV